MARKLYEMCNDDKTKQAFRDWLKSHLVYGPVTVVFEKKDGTLREMLCTLKQDLVQSYEKKTERTKTTNEEVCPVFDVEKQEWRSFRYDAVTEVRLDV